MKTLLLSLGLLFLVSIGCASAQQTQPMDPPVYRGGYTPVDVHRKGVSIKKKKVYWGYFFGPWSMTITTEFYNNYYKPGVRVNRSVSSTNHRFSGRIGRKK